LCRRFADAYFPFDRSFLIPESVVPFLEDVSNYAGQFSDRQILIVGHTDTAGAADYNQRLSRRRGMSVYAHLTGDASVWETMYDEENTPNQKWGNQEARHMLRFLQDDSGDPYFAGSPDDEGQASTDAIARFQRDNDLPDTGTADRATHRAMFGQLIETIQGRGISINSGRFLEASPGEPWLGCGEEHPFVDTGDNVAEPANRRVEVLFFLQPPSPISCEAYDDTWAEACVVGELITVRVLILNEWGEPLEVNFELDTPEGDTIRDATDAEGRWQSAPDSMPTGRYVLRLGPEPFQRVAKQLSRSDNAIEVQFLDPNRWFIPQQHADIPQFTMGNQVDALVDGKNAFEAMFGAFQTTDDDGYIYITGWDLVPEIHLLGRSVPSSQLRRVLESASTRGTDVRLLLWFGNVRFAPTIAGANIFTDNKTRGVAGSHHQKTAAVSTTDGLVSFVGGIDLTRDRWDTRDHCHPDPDADYAGNGQPWHDVHARVRGPAAADIETNFRHRWNDGNRFPGSRPSPAVPTHPAPTARVGPHIVQTLRTFPCHATAATRPWLYDFAPHGETGLRQAYLRAIGNAKEYIYIEDQYMVGDDISTALEAAMRRSSDLQVVLVTAPAPDAPGIPVLGQALINAFDFHQNEFVGRLRGVDASRVQIFHLENQATGRCATLGTPAGTDIYVHSKVCIIDDIWAIIGSCNTNRRSLTHDTEISVAVLDQNIVGDTIQTGRRAFARNLRISLWLEHLGLSASDVHLVADPMDGVREWRSRAGHAPARAVVHTRPAGVEHRITWNNLIDPDGRC
jgi:phosphatidylserine/phosphatidylglycerophosphate/cardiolipin synthase-like enzyme